MPLSYFNNASGSVDNKNVNPKGQGVILEQKYLNPKEVEKFYRIKAGTLANWRNQGRGPGYIKYGRKILYPVTELEKWCQNYQVRTVDSR